MPHILNTKATSRTVAINRLLLTVLLLGFALFLLNYFVFSTDPMSTPQQSLSAPGDKPFAETNTIYTPPVPNNMTFAGESVPIDHFDVREGFERELLINTFWHSNTMQLVKRAARFFPIIEPILAEHGVPEDMKYLAVVESSLLHPTSPAGAKGMWQFMRATAIEYGLEVNSQVDERYHVHKATEAAAEYLKEAKEVFGNWTLAAASYNRGKAGVQKQIDRQKQHNFYDLLLVEETQRYIYRILAVKYIFQDLEAYGFHLDMEDFYLPIPTYTVEVTESVDDFADFAAQYDINYKVLKYFNPWLRQTYLKVPAGKSYEIIIPEKGMRSVEKVNTYHKKTEKPDLEF